MSHNTRNHERWSFDGTDWKCLWCGKPPHEATHQGKHGLEANPYNLNQRYCSPACSSEARKLRDSERRANDAAKARQAWRCTVCGGPPSDFVRSLKARACCPYCARRAKTRYEQDRRVEHEIRAAGLRLTQHVSPGSTRDST